MQPGQTRQSQFDTRCRITFISYYSAPFKWTDDCISGIQTFNNLSMSGLRSRQMLPRCISALEKVTITHYY